MKEMLVGFAMIFIMMMTLTMNYELNLYQEQRVHLKATAEEAAASASQYFKRNNYGDGFYNFNNSQGNLALKESLKTSLRLNEDLRPTTHSYWRNSDTVQSNVTYIDYSNYMTYLETPSMTAQAFPNKYKFTHFGETHTTTLFGPSVIVSINAGKPNFTLDFLNEGSNDVIEHGIHTFEE